MAFDQIAFRDNPAFPSGVYLHIPFCRSKCPYCNFASQPLKDQAEMETYLTALKQEARQRAHGHVLSIYFGGGTPSLCPPSSIQQLMEILAQKMVLLPSVEITLEMNPAPLTSAELAAWQQAGINRLALGVQSTSDHWLHWLGRGHTSQNALDLIQRARQTGFKNIACDLIYGFPQQTLMDFTQDLKTLLQWNPDHISMYGLSIEAGTQLADWIQAGRWPEPDEDLNATMYEEGRKMLLASGYQQYELSNFAKPGKACQHNLLYWTDQSYLGLGASAHSYMSGCRSWNHAQPDVYIQSIQTYGQAQAGSETLANQQKLAEDLMLGLRLTAGVHQEFFTQKYGRNWEKPFEPALQDMYAAGLLVKEKDVLKLTEKGMLLANLVFRAIL